VEEQELTHVIAELDSKDFSARKRAIRELERLGDLAKTKGA
jgi:hypothetical protein